MVLVLSTMKLVLFLLLRRNYFRNISSVEESRLLSHFSGDPPLNFEEIFFSNLCNFISLAQHILCIEKEESPGVDLFELSLK